MLRHTFATRLIEKGADPKSVSLLLGHTTVQFTLQHYVHPDFEYLQRQVIKSLCNTEPKKPATLPLFIEAASCRYLKCYTKVVTGVANKI